MAFQEPRQYYSNYCNRFDTVQAISQVDINFKKTAISADHPWSYCTFSPWRINFRKSGMDFKVETFSPATFTVQSLSPSSVQSVVMGGWCAYCHVTSNILGTINTFKNCPCSTEFSLKKKSHITPIMSCMSLLKDTK